MSDRDNKKYYWLKLQSDFFKRHDIRIVENMTNGKDYVIFYLKLLCESTSHEGRLRFSEEIPYNEEMLATITNTNVDTVKSAIEIFSNLKMIEIFDDGTLYLSQLEKMIGSETGGAQRKREYREAKKLIGTTSGQCPLEIEKDIDLEIEKEINIVELVIDYLNKKANKHYKPVKSNAEFIKARVDEGFTLSDFEKVIDNKCATWKDTSMDQYLRPQTLFRPNNFQAYLNEKIIVSDTKQVEEKQKYIMDLGDLKGDW